MKSRWPIPSLPLPTCLAALVCSGSLALARGDNAPPGAPAAAPNGTAGPASALPPAAPSPLVIDVLRLSDAGVSVEVIRTYIECCPNPRSPTDADLIVLKQHNVPDEIATLLLQRGAQARAVSAQAKAAALRQAISVRRAASGGFDPESYSYFQYYYLQPRAMSFAAQQFYPSYPNAWQNGPGYGPSAFRRGMYPGYAGY
jgi:hypothetical protein